MIDFSVSHCIAALLPDALPPTPELHGKVKHQHTQVSQAATCGNMTGHAESLLSTLQHAS